MFSKNFPTCTFIAPYTSIRHTRVDKKNITVLIFILCYQADLDAEDKDHKMNDVQINHSSTLKIDKNLVPVDLRLHGYLSNLAKVHKIYLLHFVRGYPLASLFSIWVDNQKVVIDN